QGGGGKRAESPPTDDNAITHDPGRPERKAEEGSVPRARRPTTTPQRTTPGAPSARRRREAGREPADRRQRRDRGARRVSEQGGGDASDFGLTPREQRLDRRVSEFGLVGVEPGDDLLVVEARVTEQDDSAAQRGERAVAVDEVCRDDANAVAAHSDERALVEEAADAPGGLAQSLGNVGKVQPLDRFVHHSTIFSRGS